MDLLKLIPSFNKDVVAIIIGYLSNFSNIKTHSLTLEEEIHDIILLKDKIITTNKNKLDEIGLDGVLLKSYKSSLRRSHLIPLGDKTYSLIFDGEDQPGYQMLFSDCQYKFNSFYVEKDKLILVGDSIFVLGQMVMRYNLPSKIKLSCKVDDSLVVYTESHMVHYCKIGDTISNQVDIQLKFPITMLTATKDYIFMVRSDMICVHKIDNGTNYNINVRGVKQILTLDDYNIVMNIGICLMIYNTITKKGFTLFITSTIEKVMDSNTLLLIDRNNLIILDIYQRRKLFTKSLREIDYYTVRDNNLLLVKGKQVEIYS
jgi:hypothetical protein